MEDFIKGVTEFDSGTSSVCSEDLEDVELVDDDVVKKVIKPDDLLMTKLLNFDEVLFKKGKRNVI